MEITHESEQHRYVLSENGEFLGEVEYDRQGDTLHLVRAEVPIEKRGQGLGIPLVKGTLRGHHGARRTECRPHLPLHRQIHDEEPRV